jgi:hypothetical protein
MKIYDTLLLLTLLCGLEYWEIREQDKHRVTLGEIKFMKKRLKYA